MLQLNLPLDIPLIEQTGADVAVHFNNDMVASRKPLSDNFAYLVDLYDNIVGFELSLTKHNTCENCGQETYCDTCDSCDPSCDFCGTNLVCLSCDDCDCPTECPDCGAYLS